MTASGSSRTTFICAKGRSGRRSADLARGPRSEDGSHRRRGCGRRDRQLADRRIAGRVPRPDQEGGRVGRPGPDDVQIATLLMTCVDPDDEAARLRGAPRDRVLLRLRALPSHRRHLRPRRRCSPGQGRVGGARLRSGHRIWSPTRSSTSSAWSDRLTRTQTASSGSSTTASIRSCIRFRGASGWSRITTT